MKLQTHSIFDIPIISKRFESERKLVVSEILLYNICSKNMDENIIVFQPFDCLVLDADDWGLTYLFNYVWSRYWICRNSEDWIGIWG